MGLPTKERVWGFNKINQLYPNPEDAVVGGQRTVFSLKDSLLNYTGSPWTVKGSSNGSVAAMDGVDRWPDPSSLVAGRENTEPHSWIVLRNGTEEGDPEILIAFGRLTTHAVTSRYVMLRFAAKGGFVPSPSNDGLFPSPISALPMTSQVEVVASGTTAALSHTIVQSIGSNEGDFLWYNDYPDLSYRLFVCYFKLKNTIDQWTEELPNVFLVGSTNRMTPAELGFSSTSINRTQLIINNMVGDAALTTEAWYSEGSTRPLSTVHSTYKNVIADAWPFGMIGVASQSLSTIGRHGAIADIFWGPSALPTGTFYPDAGRSWVQVDQMIWPWDGVSDFIQVLV